MDNRSKLIKKIQRNLSDYAAAIKKDTESGRSDILIDAEEICRGLLNIVFGYKLKNLNQSNRNFPAIDLADDDQRVAVQITSSNTNAKIMNTIHKFLGHSLDQQYDTLLIFILVDTTFRQRKAPPLPPSLNLQIMTFVDLMQTIKALSIEKLDETASYLEKEIGTDDPEPSGTTALIPDLTTSVADLSEIERQVLFFAGFLPEAGLERDVFVYGLTPEQKKSVPDLINQRVLHHVETLLRVNPDIRSSIPNIIPAPNHITYFDLLWEFENSRHWDRISMKRENAVHQALAHIFSAAAERFPESALTYSLRSAELWKNIHEYSRALTQEQKALRLLKSVQPNSLEIARAHHFSGECYAELKEYNLALKDWKETLRLCRNFLHVSPYDLAEAFHYVGKAMTKLKLYEDAEDHLLSALELWENLRRSSKHVSPQPWLRGIYDSLSNVYTKLGLNTLGMRCSNNGLRSPAEQVDLWQYLAEYRLSRFQPEYGLDLPLRSSLPNGSFVGREQELAEIEKRFLTEQVVILSGIGGIGKTELAVHYAREFVQAKGHQAYMVLFSGDFRQTLLNNVAPHVANLDTKGMPESEILRRTIYALNSPGTDSLLILDNVDQADLTSLRRELSWLPMKVLITTRISDGWDEIRTLRLTQEELYKIFDRHGADVPQMERDKLIDAVAGHTMTVDMIARTLADEWCNASAEDICAAMAGSEMGEDDYPEIETDHDGDPEQRKIYGHLRALFRLKELTEEARQVLRYAALLPPEGMPPLLFREALPEECQKPIWELEKRGWIQIENDLLNIHPVVRLVCRRDLNPTVENCHNFLQWFRGQYDSTTYDREKFAQIAALYETASEVLQEKNGVWASNAGYLWNVLVEPRRALACNYRAVELLEQNAPVSTNLATAYNNLGSTYSDLGDHEKALEYMFKALGIQEQVLPPTHPELAASYNNVGSTYGALGDHEKALEYKLKALGIRELVLPSPHPDLATSYNNVGITYGALGDHEKALEYKLKALGIRERVLPPTHPDLATSYNNVGITYGNLGDYEKALDSLLKTLEIQEQMLPPSHPSLAQSYDNIGSVYNDLGDHEKALEYMLKALTIRELVLPGNHPDLAQSYSNISWSYYDTGVLPKAAQYMRRAADIICHSSLPKNHPDRVNYVKWADELGAILQQPQDPD